MLKLDAYEGGSNHTATLLEKIATVLNCPVSAFLTPTPCEPAETAELLGLWFTIADQQDRAKVLAFVRNAAANKDLSAAE